MPELPEVEHFRRLLVPLVSQTSTLSLQCPSETTPPKSFLTPEQVDALNSGNCYLAEVLRKGKLICMVLDCRIKVLDQHRVYLFLHMGMTGRISTPLHVPKLESLTDSPYPPSYTYLRFNTDSHEASFSDPRKFGSVTLSPDNHAFDQLAPDALFMSNTIPSTTGIETRMIRDAIVHQSMGIKALLLDQKRVVSGVGNWVADEVLYQCQIHPTQDYLTEHQAQQLLETLHAILTTAVQCLEDHVDFPSDWLFHCRWDKRKSTSGNTVKDPRGRTVAFVKAAGRTSAIVPSLQKKRAQKPSSHDTKTTIKDPNKEAIAKSTTTTKAKQSVKRATRDDSDNQSKVKARKTNILTKTESQVEVQLPVRRRSARLLPSIEVDKN